MTEEQHLSENLLICTVGGSHEPVISAIMHWQPARVVFVHTHESKAQIEEHVRPGLAELNAPLSSGCLEFILLPEPQDVADCLSRLSAVRSEVERWTERGDEYRVIVDFTAGTKCMSAALAVQASRWPCQFSYVGGMQRTKEGLGTVISGTERMVHQANPWDTLGLQAVEDFIVYFDSFSFTAAEHVAAVAESRASNPSRKRELKSLKNLAHAFSLWDKFSHKKSLQQLHGLKASENDFRSVLGEATGNRILSALTDIVSHMESVTLATAPGRIHALDLIANALRRVKEGRYDDAVARFYRAVEALGQAQLREQHEIASTARVPFNEIPEPLRGTLEPDENNECRLALADTYRLLALLGDELGTRYEELLPKDPKHSPISKRNRSILAHGFSPVSEGDCVSLKTFVLQLAEIDESSLPQFPNIGGLRSTPA